jgi:hypothetical protein
MSLTNILRGIGRRILGGKKESATPTTGTQQKQITYQPKPSQAQGQELATQEIKNPPIVLKKTQPLQMGDDIAPGFGSSTYDWVMRKGRGQYTADEWLDHLTSTRKVNFKVFGKPSTRIERAEKKFKYDSGPFAGKEVNISKEELFDTNVAVFDQGGNLTGGLLAAAKKFGIKLDANEIGAMIKLNPMNRLKPVELGRPSGAGDKFDNTVKILGDRLQALKVKYRNDDDIVRQLSEAQFELVAIKNGEMGKGAFRNLNQALNLAKARPNFDPSQKLVLNKLEGELNSAAAPLRSTKTYYGNERSYTLDGGTNYRETIMTLPEEIVTNSSPFNKGGHFTEVLDDATNNIYHIRFDTRFTPDGKKVFMINEIQSDVNQSISKGLQKFEQLDGLKRINPFQKDIEIKLLTNERSKLVSSMQDAIEKVDVSAQIAISNQLAKTTQAIQRMTGKGGTKDYFPMVENVDYGDHALKYLLQRAARENVDYVAVAPFDKLSFRQGYKAGNERFYGYANGKGINKSGSSIMPNVMKRTARLYGSKAGPTKISLSDPSKPYKKIREDKFSYPDSHKLKGKKIKSIYHEDAIDATDPGKAGAGYTFIESSNPALYFDAFAIKVTPLMRGTQKTYKKLGGLVVDMFKPIRYN